MTAVSTALVSLVWLGLSAQPVDAAGAMYPDAGPVAAYRYSGIGSCVTGPGDGGVVVGLNRNGAPSCSKSLGSITVGALTLDQYGTGGVDLLTDSNNNIEIYPSSGGSILLSGPVGGIYTDAGITASSMTVGVGGTPVSKIQVVTTIADARTQGLSIAAGTCSYLNPSTLSAPGASDSSVCFVTPKNVTMPGNAIDENLVYRCYSTSSNGGTVFLQACCVNTSTCTTSRMDAGSAAGYVAVTIINP